MIALSTTTTIARKRRPHVDDTKFIDALDLKAYRTAPEIARHMLRAGHPASLALIAKRMTEFVAIGGVEAKGQAWRIEPDCSPGPPTPEPSSSNDNAPQITIPSHHRSPTLHRGCGLEMMRGLPDHSVDLVLTDLPYGISGLAIDPTINVPEWMAEMARIVTDRGAIVAFAAQPFTTDLILASRQFDKGKQMFFKQALVWEKPQPTGFAQARARHLKAHEDILIFSRGTVIGQRGGRQMTYNPQGAWEVEKKARIGTRSISYLRGAVRAEPGIVYSALENCPRSVLRFAKDRDAQSLHSFAKPVALLEYLIRTYTNDNGVVLDPTMGSGSTGVAAINTERRFIGAENGTDRKGQDIFTIAADRIVATIDGI